jgi:hypothetical protein
VAERRLGSCGLAPRIDHDVVRFLPGGSKFRHEAPRHLLHAVTGVLVGLVRLVVSVESVGSEGLVGLVGLEG